ncbi:unnamed protein product [Vicia faba]|uniref:Uncharacterized protein n=1 Tax=Vicia faba TaxID=3906 RepID=A0AAV0ZM78_VICFA|nr:unnamed protein product [Vicia faba]
MEICGILKHIENIDCFPIAKLSSQSNPEIDPRFVKFYGDEITKSWTVLNNQGVHHEPIINKVSIHPLVISGWSCLEAYYNLPKEVVATVIITYSSVSEQKSYNLS